MKMVAPNEAAPSDVDHHARQVLDEFKKRSQFHQVDWKLKERTDGNYLVIYLCNPTDRFFRLLNEVLESVPEENPYRERTTLKSRADTDFDRLKIPETQHLRTVLSESLTVTKHSFEEDFFARYISSVFGAEEQIIADGNHIVYGRRGAGKSSLLAYLLHRIETDRVPHAWVDMQTYSGRDDALVVADVIYDVIAQIESNSLYSGVQPIAQSLDALLDAENEEEVLEKIDRLVPRIRRAVSPSSNDYDKGIIFIDDLHVIAPALQPVLLGKLYSICRGNQLFLKMSGIEQFTRTWDASSREGLESTDDVQEIRLDYNLTRPGKSKEHIKSILEAHAVYCGLPSIAYIRRTDVMPRLVWAAAGVPRDALSIFAQALARSMVEDRQKVTVTNVNVATSEMAESKIKDVETDASERYDEVQAVLEEVRKFCVDQKRINAFLVEKDSTNPRFENLQELIALRLLHVIHEGITPREAGSRYVALMLDYSFYVGIRAARSVKLFQKEPKQLKAKELRSLPIYKL